MEKPLKGEIVVVPFPFSDLSDRKRRPALVAASLDGDDLILCQITKSNIREKHAIAITNEDIINGSLFTESKVIASKLFTADKNIVLYAAGKISSIADLVVLAYGNHGAYRNRHEEILKMVKNPYCIKITKMNLPTHPLYTSYTEEPIPFLLEK